MTLNVLDAEGLPRADIEITLAHHLLGRPNPLAKQIVYALFGSPRRNGELAQLTGGSDNNLTQVLKLLRDEGIIGTIVDARTRPAAVAYKLSPFGYLVADRMRRYEWQDELVQDRSRAAHPVTG